MKVFEESFDLMKDTPNGLLLEAMSRVWYGESLSKKGDWIGSIEQMEKAYQIYERLFNYSQMEKVKWLMNAKIEING